MTEEEFNSFFDRVFIAFPNVKEYLLFNSPDYTKTLREWFPILEPFPKADCHAVVEGWLRGSIPMFEAKERGYFCLIVRSRILAHREELKKAHRQAEQRDNSIAYRNAKASLVKTPDMEAYISRIFPFNKQLERGEISEQTWKEERDKIYRDYCDSLQKKPSQESHHNDEVWIASELQEN